MIIPEKTIAFYPVIPDAGIEEFDMDISTFLKPLNENHKRDWFTPHFYKCLPLSIGNMQGFVFSLPFDVEVMWNGGSSPNDLTYVCTNLDPKIVNMNHVNINSEFGHGIFTIHFPLVLKTPPGVNLMTIAPPNFILTGLTPMTGVVETDNLKFTFTLNVKVDIPNSRIVIQKGCPLVGILPIPRYFCDSFELVNAYDLFEKDIIEEERLIVEENSKLRNDSNKEMFKTNKYSADKLYYNGMDVRKNKFKDHQLPRKNK